MLDSLLIYVKRPKPDPRYAGALVDVIFPDGTGVSIPCPANPDAGPAHMQMYPRVAPMSMNVDELDSELPKPYTCGEGYDHRIIVPVPIKLGKDEDWPIGFCHRLSIRPKYGTRTVINYGPEENDAFAGALLKGESRYRFSHRTGKAYDIEGAPSRLMFMRTRRQVVREDPSSWVASDTLESHE